MVGAAERARGAGKAPASELFLNFKRLIRKRRPFPSLEQPNAIDAGIQGAFAEAVMRSRLPRQQAGKRGGEGLRVHVCVHTPVHHTCVHVIPGAPALTREVENSAFGCEPSLFPDPHPPPPSSVFVTSLELSPCP